MPRSPKSLYDQYRNLLKCSHSPIYVVSYYRAAGVVIKDYVLMKWTGANSFRTSHYPYDEEYLRLADRLGFLIIDETPAVGLYFHGDADDLGERETGAQLLAMELDGLHQRFNKPIIVTEFGADTYPGLHAVEPEMFTEEFQVEFLKGYLDVADARDFVAGMHVWAFSDFRTSQGLIRFGGMNYKGVFTRDRKPKAAAHFLRSRWAKP